MLVLKIRRKDTHKFLIIKMFFAQMRHRPADAAVFPESGVFLEFVSGFQGFVLYLQKHFLRYITMGKFLSDFKEFAMRGNVVDMAVGVVIGGAFGKIVTSLVGEIIMPAVGVITGGVNFSDLKWVIKDAATDAAGTEIPEVAIGYGAFIQSVLDFLIIAFCIFVAIRIMMKLKKKEEVKEEAAAPAAPTQEQLLTEIRDLLKERD